MLNFSGFFKASSYLFVSDTGISNSDYGVFCGRPSFSGIIESPKLMHNFKEIEIKDVGSSLTINALDQCLATIPKDLPDTKRNFLALFDAPEVGEINLHDMELVAATMADKDVRYYLNGVFLCPSGNIVSTDGHRISVLKNGANFAPATVPRGMILSVVKLVKMVKYKGSIVIRQSAGCTGFFLGDYCIVGNNLGSMYPDYKRVIPMQTDYLCNINPTDLIKWLKSIAPLIANQKYPSVCFDDAGGIFVQHDSKRIYYAGQGQGIVLGICFDYLLKLVSLYKKEKTIALRNASNEKLALECGSALHVIMGIRV